MYTQTNNIIIYKNERFPNFSMEARLNSISFNYYFADFINLCEKKHWNWTNANSVQKNHKQTCSGWSEYDLIWTTVWPNWSELPGQNRNYINWFYYEFFKRLVLGQRQWFYSRIFVLLKSAEILLFWFILRKTLRFIPIFTSFLNTSQFNSLFYKLVWK